MAQITPYQICVDQKFIDLLKIKLSTVTWPDDGAICNDWQYGAPLHDIKRLVSRWHNGFDWRAQEAKFNQLPQFTTNVTVGGFAQLNIHFIHKRSSRPEAIPLLFVHGWPGSFIEVTKVLSLLTEPEEGQPFHVVAPSLPNYGFSSGVSDPNFALPQYAEAMHKTMIQLNYSHYVTQGGDWGYHITRHIGLLYPTHCLASHVNFVSLTENPSTLQSAPPNYTEEEQAGLRRTDWFQKEGLGYQTQQGTRPTTLAFALRDSPVALLAWIYEKLHDWTDSYSWEDDEVLTWVSIYQFSRAGPQASIYIYYESEHAEQDMFRKALRQYIPTVRLGVSLFPKDLKVPPDSWIKELGSVVYLNRQKKGGHFAAYERPEDLMQDLISAPSQKFPDELADFTGVYWTQGDPVSRLIRAYAAINSQKKSKSVRRISLNRQVKNIMTTFGFPVSDPVTSYWQLPPHRIANHQTTPELPSYADYVIIGSGITGATIAYKLLEHNPTALILMIEARTAASAASGRNGGHCRAGWWYRFPSNVQQYGEDEAIKIDNLEQANVRGMADFVQLHKIDCDFKPVETAEIFKTQERLDRAEELIKIRREVSQRRPDAGIAVNQKLLKGKKAQEAFGIPGIVGATIYPAFTQNPYLLVCEMLELSLGKGLNLQTNTTVTTIDQGDDLWSVHTQRGAVQARNVILATNAYTNALYPQLASTGFLVPSQRQLAAIRPGSKAQDLPAMDKSCALSDYNSGDYFLVRQAGLHGAGDIVYGGGEHISAGAGCTDDSRINNEIAEYLHHAVADYVGHDAWGTEGKVVQDWVGITCYTPDHCPLVGEAPGQPGLWLSVGMNGHGMAFAYKCAEALVQMIEGSEPHWLPKAFRLDRVFHS
ncbi:hypothetical protein ACHAP7_011077 [Fusarium lateritium]